MFFKKSNLVLAFIPVIFSCTLPGTISDSTSSLATKADALKYFECALNNPGLTEQQKTNIRSAVIAQINLVPDSAWAQAKASFETFAKTFACNTGTAASASPSASSGTPTPSASPSSSSAPLKTAAGITEYSCDSEKSLKSASGPSINITFSNNTNGSVKLYWLNQAGNRISYNSNLAKGGKHPQQTFVTHPWLVTDANDKCLKIFVPSDISANNANINI